MKAEEWCPNLWGRPSVAPHSANLSLKKGRPRRGAPTKLGHYRRKEKSPRLFFILFKILSPAVRECPQ
jgi:hypothetical protein